jgi:hypothetical protein
VITRQAFRRDSFTSVKELTSAIGAFIDHWNSHPHPFTWTKGAYTILDSIKRATTKHQVIQTNRTAAGVAIGKSSA